MYNSKVRAEIRDAMNMNKYASTPDIHYRILK